ncbi:MAG: hypothetical protein ACRBCJ_06380 [Hyphomicrobiaceae bacterium]
MTNSDPDNTPVPTSFLPQAGDEPGVRTLKIVVLGLGALLVIGMMVMIAKIGHMIANPTPANPRPLPVASQAAKAPATPAAPSEPASPAAQSTQHIGVVLPPLGSLTAPKSGSVTHMALSGDRLALHYTTPTGPIIVIVDLKSGREIQRLKVVQP